MRNGWIETTLDKVTECSWGNTETTKSKYVESGYLAYSASGADGFLDWFEHDRSAVVLSAIGAQCGKTWFADGKWTSIKNTIWLKSDNLKLLDKYLYYLSNRAHFWQIRGQAQPFISLGDVKKTKVLLPPLSEQKRIVDLISSVDSYMEALQQQLVSAERSRSAVLHKLLTSSGDDWVETSLGDIAQVVGGGTPSTKTGEYWDGDIIWLTPTEITSQDGKVVVDSIRKITELGFKNSGAQMLPIDSVILTSRASIGYVALAGKELCTNQGFQSLIPNQSVLSKFLMFWIQLNRPEFESRSAGSTFKEISKSNVKSIKLQLPPLHEQERIVEIINTFDEVITQTILAASKAKDLRSGLLSDLLSSEHEIPSSYDKVIGAA
jgi:type I restriction enzyme S subunit